MFTIKFSKKRAKSTISSLLVITIILSMAFLSPIKAADPNPPQNLPQGNNVSVANPTKLNSRFMELDKSRLGIWT